MSKNELAWQLQDNAVWRFYLTLDLGFWGMTIVRIEDNVLKSKWFEKITCKLIFDKPFTYFWVICYLSSLLIIWIFLQNLHMNFTLECSYIWRILLLFTRDILLLDRKTHWTEAHRWLNNLISYEPPEGSRSQNSMKNLSMPQRQIYCKLRRSSKIFFLNGFIYYFEYFHTQNGIL
jgi:hypothetical protein